MTCVHDNIQYCMSAQLDLVASYVAISFKWRTVDKEHGAVN